MKQIREMMRVTESCVNLLRERILIQKMQTGKMLRITKSFDDDYDDLMLNEDEDCISLLMLSIDVIIVSLVIFGICLCIYLGSTMYFILIMAIKYRSCHILQRKRII